MTLSDILIKKKKGRYIIAKSTDCHTTVETECPSFVKSNGGKKTAQQPSNHFMNYKNTNDALGQNQMLQNLQQLYHIHT